MVKRNFKYLLLNEMLKQVQHDEGRSDGHGEIASVVPLSRMTSVNKAILNIIELSR
jgi:hypothetical protein